MNKLSLMKGLMLTSLSTCIGHAEYAKAQRPNILFAFGDDLG